MEREVETFRRFCAAHDIASTATQNRCCLLALVADTGIIATRIDGGTNVAATENTNICSSAPDSRRVARLFIGGLYALTIGYSLPAFRPSRRILWVVWMACRGTTASRYTLAVRREGWRGHLSHCKDSKSQHAGHEQNFSAFHRLFLQLFDLKRTET